MPFDFDTQHHAVEMPCGHMLCHACVSDIRWKSIVAAKRCPICKASTWAPLGSDATKHALMKAALERTAVEKALSARVSPWPMSRADVASPRVSASVAENTLRNMRMSAWKNCGDRPISLLLSK